AGPAAGGAAPSRGPRAPGPRRTATTRCRARRGVRVTAVLAPAPDLGAPTARLRLWRDGRSRLGPLFGDRPAEGPARAAGRRDPPRRRDRLRNPRALERRVLQGRRALRGAEERRLPDHGSARRTPGGRCSLARL